MCAGLAGLDNRRLRWLLFGFFLALAIPAAVLINQARSQLKWEAFYQYRLLAEEFSGRIDERLETMIELEERAAFEDYRFLKVDGDPAAGFRQRSRLSSYPVESAVPGVIAYFQVDTQGRLTTPLLPDPDVAATNYGVAAAELERRVELETEIRAILSENRLVEAQPPASFGDRAALEEAVLAAADDATIARSYSDRDTPAALASAAPPSAANEPLDQVRGQAAFDELNLENAAEESAAGKASVQALGRVSELKLEDAYVAEQQKLAEAEQQPRRNEQRAAKRMRRSEAATEADVAQPAAIAGAASPPPRRDQPIETFAGELDPFEFSLLDSGHLVLFRKVWRDGQRYIQGALIDRQSFIAGAFGEPFAATALSRMSNLIVAWRGDVLEVFSGEAERRYLSSAEELSGALLYQTRLSAPLADFELIVSINELPAGPGATVVTLTAAILGAVLVGGFLVLYRLGSGQIELARQQQDFVSAVSHELKTPLTSIRMYGEMLQAGWADEEKKQSYYAYIHDESERLSRLIENVLQLARLTRNDPQFDRTDVTVAELLDMIRSKIGDHVERAGFTLSIEQSKDLATSTVNVDTDCFTQIVINLIDNAIKFSAGAGHQAIDITARREADHVAFSVRDYGPGIPRGQLRKIFRLFYRSESELTRETVGTGIGLALVSQLAVAMDGSVDVTNCEPGAEFTVRFPVR